MHYLLSVKNQKGQRYDLTKWTYTQLRDYINTSTDIDMIQACRDEFARRLQAYHNWRAKVKISKLLIVYTKPALCKRFK